MTPYTTMTIHCRGPRQWVAWLARWGGGLFERDCCGHQHRTLRAAARCGAQVLAEEAEREWLLAAAQPNTWAREVLGPPAPNPVPPNDPKLIGRRRTT